MNPTTQPHRTSSSTKFNVHMHKIFILIQPKFCSSTEIFLNYVYTCQIYVATKTFNYLHALLIYVVTMDLPLHYECTCVYTCSKLHKLIAGNTTESMGRGGSPNAHYMEVQQLRKFYLVFKLPISIPSPFMPEMRMLAPAILFMASWPST